MLQVTSGPCAGRLTNILISQATFRGYLRLNKIGCIVSRDVSDKIGPHRSVGMKSQLAKEWTHSVISSYGSSKAAVQKSLRKKMYEHAVSIGHKEATKTINTSQKGLLQAAVEEQCNEEYAHIFRTYFIAYNNKPYTDHPELICKN